jgi:sugar phosphate isomerase/epimerase
MKLAISNIAWDIPEDTEIAELLKQYGVDAIDVAPGKYFPDPTKATDKEITQVKHWWEVRGIRITGMQALLFGSVGLNLFGPHEVQDAMLKHLSAVCRIGAGLGATRLVFGSPKNRDRNGISDEQAMEIAVQFFRKLGDIALSYGVVICLEPNPSCYGSNFMMNSIDTAEVVRQVAHPAIRMQLDTGALTINGENPATALQNSAELIGHIHASEPELVPLGDGGTDHMTVADCLRYSLPDHIVSIEMLATKNEPHRVAIERSLGVAIRHYRNNGKRVEE